MDTIAAHLRKVCRKVAVPRSVPGLVTPRLLVMEFMQGQPLLQVGAWGAAPGAPGLCCSTACHVHRPAAARPAHALDCTKHLPS